MAVHRVEKKKHFTVMYNYHLRDKRLSLKAIGLMSLLLSLPEDWEYSVHGLAQITKDGVTSIRSALKELEEFHYLKRTTKTLEGKIVGMDYEIWERPVDGPEIYIGAYNRNEDF